MPSLFQLIGGLALLVMLTPLWIVLYFVGKTIFGNVGGPDSTLDEFFRSRRGNHNPPHIPPSYTPSMGFKWGDLSRGNSYLAQQLDPPEVQKAKYEESLTTTTKEIRALQTQVPDT